MIIPGDDAVSREVRALVLFIFDSVPHLKSVKVEVGDYASGEFRVAGSAEIDREQLTALKMGNGHGNFVRRD